MMSALVSGAHSAKDCVTAGWPEWLANLNTALFDANTGADDEDAARYRFALDVARAVQEPRDYDRARDLFLIARLDTGEYSVLKSLDALSGDWIEQRQAVEAVVKLLHRRVSGEDVSREMEQAADAAHAVARAVRAADAAAYAAYAAYAAARAARAVRAAIYAAAYATARADLIAALRAA
jgi:hypothetical protein